MASHSIIIYIFVVGDLPLFAYIELIGIQLMYIGIYLGVFGAGSNIFELSKFILRLGKSASCVPLELKQVKAIPPIRFLVWKLPLNKEFIKGIFHITISNAIDLILADKAR